MAMNDSATVNWVKKAAELSLRTDAFIGGRAVAAASGKRFPTINPTTGRPITEVAECDSEDVNRAVAAARVAFDKGVWSKMAPDDRRKRMIRFADLIEANLEELALLDTIDAGKPISSAIVMDVPKSARTIRWCGEAIDKLYDEIAPTAPNALSLIRREPLGVVAAIVPWNYPLFMTSWKIGPILAAGNSIIIKPAEQSPLSALRLGELAMEAGIPEGVFNVVPGYGETAGRALGLHMDVDAIAFTGSTEVGKLFMIYSGQSNMKRVTLECGGKSPLIILADAPDLDAAARSAAWGLFHNSGQSCDAAARLIVERSIKDKFVERVIKVAAGYKVGDPLDTATELGPIISETQMQRILGYIEKGSAEGATLKLGGKRVAGYDGYFLEPTVFDHVTNDMTIAKEEIFGPVLSVLEATDLEQAIKIANDTDYGLASGIWTRDINKAIAASKALVAGVVSVNNYADGDITTPFGGFKRSGFGRDKSLHAIEKYSDLKATWIKLDA